MLWNVGFYKNHTASYPRRHSSTIITTYRPGRHSSSSVQFSSMQCRTWERQEQFQFSFQASQKLQHSATYFKQQFKTILTLFSFVWWGQRRKARAAEMLDTSVPFFQHKTTTSDRKKQESESGKICSAFDMYSAITVHSNGFAVHLLQI
jgi:hypothetical protein